MTTPTLKSYQHILDRILSRLDKTRENEVIYQVPPFFVGDTSYNSRQCKVFLIAKLRNLGYDVTYKSPNLLYVRKEAIRGTPPFPSPPTVSPTNQQQTTNSYNRGPRIPPRVAPGPNMINGSAHLPLSPMSNHSQSSADNSNSNTTIIPSIKQSRNNLDGRRTTSRITNRNIQKPQARGIIGRNQSITSQLTNPNNRRNVSTKKDKGPKKKRKRKTKGPIPILDDDILQIISDAL